MSICIVYSTLCPKRHAVASQAIDYLTSVQYAELHPSFLRFNNDFYDPTLPHWLPY